MCSVPEELGESLESESWSVGLDGLNVGMRIFMLCKWFYFSSLLFPSKRF